MQFLGSRATGDKSRLLHFSTQTLETFGQHIQASNADREAGGLLLGSVHGAHLLIEHATVPSAWDKRFHYLFERMLLVMRLLRCRNGRRLKEQFVIWASGIPTLKIFRFLLLSPDGQPNSPVCGHLKLPHLS